MSEDNDRPLPGNGDDDSSSADDWAAALDEQREEEQHDADGTQANAGAGGARAGQGGTRAPEWLGEGAVDPATAAPLFPEEFSESVPGNVDQVNLDMVLDVPVTISMEIGRTKIPIRNLLQLNQGSVVELDRLAGEPLNVLVNGTLIAHGEVVVVNEKFGIRLTDVISASERIRKLNK